MRGGGAGGGSAGPDPLTALAALTQETFGRTALMATDTVHSLMTALGEVLSHSLPTQPPQGYVELHALNRMVGIILANLPRILDLWPIFLSHVLEVLGSPYPRIRAIALEALEHTITAALGSKTFETAPSSASNPDQSSSGAHYSAAAATEGPEAGSAFAAAMKEAGGAAASDPAGGGGGSSFPAGTMDDLQHMLLVRWEQGEGRMEGRGGRRGVRS